MTHRWRLALVVSLLSGCARVARPVEFQGLSAEPVVGADAVQEASVVPRDAQRLGRLFVRCRPVSPGSSFSDRSLHDVDCSEERLRRLLRVAAAERGGDVLSELTCEQRSSVSCRATLARRERHRTEAAGAPVAPDVRGELGANVWVNYRASGISGERPARAEQNVRELAVPSPAQRTLGSLETRCEACSELSARDALRIAAGRLGASDVVGVRCVPEGQGQHCLGLAAVWERSQTP